MGAVSSLYSLARGEGGARKLCFAVSLFDAFQEQIIREKLLAPGQPYDIVLASFNSADLEQTSLRKLQWYYVVVGTVAALPLPGPLSPLLR
jgi:hypothetical protein